MQTLHILCVRWSFYLSLGACVCVCPCDWIGLHNHIWTEDLVQARQNRIASTNAIKCIFLCVYFECLLLLFFCIEYWMSNRSIVLRFFIRCFIFIWNTWVALVRFKQPFPNVVDFLPPNFSFCWFFLVAHEVIQNTFRCTIYNALLRNIPPLRWSHHAIPICDIAWVVTFLCDISVPRKRKESVIERHLFLFTMQFGHFSTARDFNQPT